MESYLINGPLHPCESFWYLNPRNSEYFIGGPPSISGVVPAVVGPFSLGLRVGFYTLPSALLPQTDLEFKSILYNAQEP